MTKFKKGDAVVVVKSWDDKGTIWVRRGVVHSSGVRVTRLQYSNGEMFKAAFGSSIVNRPSFAIVADADDVTIEAFAMSQAEAFLAETRERLDRAKSQSTNMGYKANIDRALAELHEPRVQWH